MAEDINASFNPSCDHIKVETETQCKQQTLLPWGSRGTEGLQLGTEIRNHPEMVGGRREEDARLAEWD